MRPGAESTDMDVDDRMDGHIAEEVARARCLVEGCPCKDPRIVSHRRARFYAHMALINGETARRVVRPEPGWELPHTG